MADEFGINNGGQNEHLEKFKHGVKKDQIDKKQKKLFDIFDENKNGELDSEEIKVIESILSQASGADKILDNNENEIVKSIFNNRFGIKDADFMGFSKTLSDAAKVTDDVSEEAEYSEKDKLNLKWTPVFNDLRLAFNKNNLTTKTVGDRIIQYDNGHIVNSIRITESGMFESVTYTEYEINGEICTAIQIADNEGFKMICVSEVDENGNYKEEDILNKTIYDSNGDVKEKYFYENGRIKTKEKYENNELKLKAEYTYTENEVIRVETDAETTRRTTGAKVDTDGNLDEVKEFVTRHTDGTGTVIKCGKTENEVLKLSRIEEDFSYKEEDITEREFKPAFFDTPEEKTVNEELHKILAYMFDVAQGKQKGSLSYDKNLISKFLTTLGQEGNDYKKISDNPPVYAIKYVDENGVEHSGETIHVSFDFHVDYGSALREDDDAVYSIRIKVPGDNIAKYYRFSADGTFKGVEIYNTNDPQKSHILHETGEYEALEYEDGIEKRRLYYNKSGQCVCVRDFIVSEENDKQLSAMVYTYTEHADDDKKPGEPSRKNTQMVKTANGDRYYYRTDVLDAEGNPTLDYRIACDSVPILDKDNKVIGHRPIAGLAVDATGKITDTKVFSIKPLKAKEDGDREDFSVVDNELRETALDLIIRGYDNAIAILEGRLEDESILDFSFYINKAAELFGGGTEGCIEELKKKRDEVAALKERLVHDVQYDENGNITPESAERLRQTYAQDKAEFERVYSELTGRQFNNGERQKYLSCNMSIRHINADLQYIYDDYTKNGKLSDDSIGLFKKYSGGQYNEELLNQFIQECEQSKVNIKVAKDNNPQQQDIYGQTTFASESLRVNRPNMLPLEYEIGAVQPLQTTLGGMACVKVLENHQSALSKSNAEIKSILTKDENLRDFSTVLDLASCVLEFGLIAKGIKYVAKGISFCSKLCKTGKLLKYSTTAGEFLSSELKTAKYARAAINAGKGSLNMAASLGIYNGLDEFGHQAVSGNFDAGKIWQSSATGMKIGAIAGAASSLVSPYIMRLYKPELPEIEEAVGKFVERKAGAAISGEELMNTVCRAQSVPKIMATGGLRTILADLAVNTAIFTGASSVITLFDDKSIKAMLKECKKSNPLAFNYTDAEIDNMSKKDLMAAILKMQGVETAGLSEFEIYEKYFTNEYLNQFKGLGSLKIAEYVIGSFITKGSMNAGIKAGKRSKALGYEFENGHYYKKNDPNKTPVSVEQMTAEAKMAMAYDVLEDRLTNRFNRYNKQPMNGRELMSMIWGDALSDPAELSAAEGMTIEINGKSFKVTTKSGEVKTVDDIEGILEIYQECIFDVKYEDIRRKAREEWEASQNGTTQIKPPTTEELEEAKAVLELNNGEELTENAVRQKVRELTQKYHPDRNADAAAAQEMQQQINRAKDIMKRYFAAQRAGNEPVTVTAPVEGQLYLPSYNDVKVILETVIGCTENKTEENYIEEVEIPVKHRSAWASCKEQLKSIYQDLVKTKKVTKKILSKLPTVANMLKAMLNDVAFAPVGAKIRTMLKDINNLLLSKEVIAKNLTTDSDLSYKTQDITFNGIDNAVEAYNTNAEFKAEVDAKIPDGEAGCINGKMYCKADGRLIRINLTKEKFDELFPTELRYDIVQGNLGDCWFLANLGGYMATPNGRACIYQMFRQEGNDIYIQFPGIDNVEIKFENGDLNKLSPVSIYREYGSTVVRTGMNKVFASKGIQMIEQALAFARVNKYLSEPLTIDANDQFLMNKQMQLLTGGNEAEAIRYLGQNNKPLFFHQSDTFGGIVLSDEPQLSLEDALDKLADTFAQNPNVICPVTFHDNVDYKGCDMSRDHAYRIVGYNKETKEVMLIDPHNSELVMKVPLEIFRQTNASFFVEEIGVNEPKAAPQTTETKPLETIPRPEGTNVSIDEVTELTPEQIEELKAKLEQEVLNPAIAESDIHPQYRSLWQSCKTRARYILESLKGDNPKITPALENKINELTNDVETIANANSSKPTLKTRLGNFVSGVKYLFVSKPLTEYNNGSPASQSAFKSRMYKVFRVISTDDIEKLYELYQKYPVEIAELIEFKDPWTDPENSKRVLNLNKFSPEQIINFAELYVKHRDVIKPLLSLSRPDSDYNHTVPRYDGGEIVRLTALYDKYGQIILDLAKLDDPQSQKAVDANGNEVAYPRFFYDSIEKLAKLEKQYGDIVTKLANTTYANSSGNKFAYSSYEIEGLVKYYAQDNEMSRFLQDPNYFEQIKQNAVGKYAKEFIEIFEPGKIDAETQMSMISSGLSVAEFMESLRKVSKYTYKVAYETPQQYLSDVPGEYSNPISDNKYPEVPEQEMKRLRYRVNDFFGDNIGRLCRAFKYLDADTISHLMDKRTEHFAEELYGLSKLSDENFEMLAQLLNCKSENGKALTVKERMEVINIVQIYSKAELDMSILREALNSGTIDITKIKNNIEEEVLRKAGVQEMDLPRAKTGVNRFNDKFFYLSLLDKADNPELDAMAEFVEANIRAELKDRMKLAEHLREAEMQLEQLKETLSLYVGAESDTMIKNFEKFVEMLRHPDDYTEDEIVKQAKSTIFITNNVHTRSDEIYTVIREAVLGNFNEFITDTSNIYGQANAATKEMFRSEGLNHDKWLEPDLGKFEFEVNGKKLSVKLWDRNPQEDLFIGNKTTCCTAIGTGGNGAATPGYLLNHAFQVIELYDEKGNVVGMSRVFMANVNGKPVLIMDNLELNNGFCKDIKDIGQVRDGLFEYINKYAQQVTGDPDTQVYFNAAAVKVPVSDLSAVNSSLSFIGKIAEPETYLNTLLFSAISPTGWADPAKLSKSDEYNFYEVPKDNKVQGTYTKEAPKPAAEHPVAENPTQPVSVPVEQPVNPAAYVAPTEVVKPVNEAELTPQEAKQVFLDLDFTEEELSGINFAHKNILGVAGYIKALKSLDMIRGDIEDYITTPDGRKQMLEDLRTPDRLNDVDEFKYFNKQNITYVQKYVDFDFNNKDLLENILSGLNCQTPDKLFEVLPMLAHAAGGKLSAEEFKQFNWGYEEVLEKITPLAAEQMYKVNSQLNGKLKINVYHYNYFSEPIADEKLNSLAKEVQRIDKFGILKSDNFMEGRWDEPAHLQEVIDELKTVNDFLEKYPIDFGTDEDGNKVKVRFSELLALSKNNNPEQVQEFINTLSDNEKQKNDFSWDLTALSNGEFRPSKALAELVNATHKRAKEIFEALGDVNYEDVLLLYNEISATNNDHRFDFKYLIVKNHDFKGALEYLKRLVELDVFDYSSCNNLYSDAFGPAIEKENVNFAELCSVLDYMKENNLLDNVHKNLFCSRLRSGQQGQLLEDIKKEQYLLDNNFNHSVNIANINFNNVDYSSYKEKIDFGLSNKIWHNTASEPDYYNIQRMANTDLSLDEVKQLVDVLEKEYIDVLNAAYNTVDADTEKYALNQIRAIIAVTNKANLKLVIDLCRKRGFDKSSIPSIAEHYLPEYDEFIREIADNPKFPQKYIGSLCDIMQNTLDNNPEYVEFIKKLYKDPDIASSDQYVDLFAIAQGMGANNCHCADVMMTLYNRPDFDNKNLGYIGRLISDCGYSSPEILSPENIDFCVKLMNDPTISKDKDSDFTDLFNNFNSKNADLIKHLYNDPAFDNKNLSKIAQVYRNNTYNPKYFDFVVEMLNTPGVDGNYVSPIVSRWKTDEAVEFTKKLFKDPNRKELDIFSLLGFYNNEATHDLVSELYNNPDLDNKHLKKILNYVTSSANDEKSRTTQIKTLISTPEMSRWLNENLNNASDLQGNFYKGYDMETIVNLARTQKKLFNEAQFTKKDNKVQRSEAQETAEAQGAEVQEAKSEEVQQVIDALVELGMNANMAEKAYVKLCMDDKGFVDKIRLEAVLALVKTFGIERTVNDKGKTRVTPNVSPKDIEYVFDFAVGSALSNANGQFRPDIIRDILTLRQAGVTDVRLATDLAAIKNMNLVEMKDRFNTLKRNDINQRAGELPESVKAAAKAAGLDIDAITDKAMAEPKGGKVQRVEVESVTLRQLDDIFGAERILITKHKQEIEQYAKDKGLNGSQDVWGNEEAFKHWTEERLADLLDFDKHPEYLAEGQYAQINPQRKESLENWYKYLTMESDYKDNPFVHLLVLESMVKTYFKPDSAGVLPAVSHEAFNAAHDALLQEGNSNVSFEKIYAEQTRAKAIAQFGRGKQVVDGIEGEWVTIPRSQKGDPDYDEHIAMVQALAEGSSWCLRFDNAHGYLQGANIHYFIDKYGRAQVAIEERDGNIRQIQKRRNQNSTVPIPYVTVIDEFMKANNLGGIDSQMKRAMEAKPKFDEMKAKMEKLMAEENYIEIFKELNIIVTVAEDGTYIINTYNAEMNDGYTLSELGIDENKLMSNVSEIRGQVNLDGSTLTEMKKLRKVTGSIKFGDNKINDLRALEELAGHPVTWIKPETSKPAEPEKPAETVAPSGSNPITPARNNGVIEGTGNAQNPQNEQELSVETIKAEIDSIETEEGLQAYRKHLGRTLPKTIDKDTRRYLCNDYINIRIDYVRKKELFKVAMADLGKLDSVNGCNKFKKEWQNVELNREDKAELWAAFAKKEKQVKLQSEILNSIEIPVSDENGMVDHERMKKLIELNFDCYNALQLEKALENVRTKADCNYLEHCVRNIGRISAYGRTMLLGMIKDKKAELLDDVEESNDIIDWVYSDMYKEFIDDYRLKYKHVWVEFVEYPLQNPLYLSLNPLILEINDKLDAHITAVGEPRFVFDEETQTQRLVGNYGLRGRNMITFGKENPDNNTEEISEENQLGVEFFDRAKAAGLTCIIDLRAKAGGNIRIKEDKITEVDGKTYIDGVEYYRIPLDHNNQSGGVIDQYTIKKLGGFFQRMENEIFYIGCANGMHRTDYAFCLNYVLNTKTINTPKLESLDAQKSEFGNAIRRIYNKIQEILTEAQTNPQLLEEYNLTPDLLERLPKSEAELEERIKRCCS